MPSSVAIFFMTANLLVNNCWLLAEKLAPKMRLLTFSDLRVLQSLYCHRLVVFDGLEDVVVRVHLLHHALDQHESLTSSLTCLGRR